MCSIQYNQIELILVAKKLKVSFEGRGSLKNCFILKVLGVRFTRRCEHVFFFEVVFLRKQKILRCHRMDKDKG